MSRTEVIVRVVAYVALFVGGPALLVFGWILFVPGEALCDGEVMSPGQTCGLFLEPGDSYEEMVAETNGRRVIAQVAAGVAAVGLIGVPAVEIYRRRQGPAPRWFTPETVLGDHPGTVTPQLLQRATVAFTERLAERERAVGPDHLDTLTWRYNLASVLVLAGDADRAILLYEAVAAGRRRALGPDHRDTLTAETGVAYAHAMGGDPALADTLCQALRARAERLLPAGDRLLQTILRAHGVAVVRSAGSI
ncbi:tetratricopeptide repeat protein [Promicromonospora sp. Populi]|uniref:tetratricopeptide repeat protein n=1 Tax=Promicromonospora sp. Populi TaxID=3239420 RepID=UPI0034E2EE18